jgi:hypothetical protein
MTPGKATRIAFDGVPSKGSTHHLAVFHIHRSHAFHDYENGAPFEKPLDCIPDARHFNEQAGSLVS